MSEIRERFVERHSKSAQLYEKSKNLFPDGVTHDARRMEPFPLYITHGQGPLKWDVDGNEFIDYFGGHGALILGHNHPEVVKAVNEQMSKGTQFAFNSELEMEWAEWIKKLKPSIEKVRFHSSGTEATMMAMRLARAYTGKTKIIKFFEHFHGWNDYAAAGTPKGLGGIPAETLSTMVVLPPGDISLVEKALQEDDNIAGIIVESTGAHMGNIPIRPEFLHELREVTTKYGIVFIMDEVVTGFRVSKGGAQGRFGLDPDLTTLAKIVGGGLPGGAVGGKTDIINMIQQQPQDPVWNNTRRVAHQGTFNANPLCAAAGTKALELVATTDVNEKADAAAQLFKNGMNNLLAKMEIPGCATGLASMVQLRLGWAHECDHEICLVTEEDIEHAQAPSVIGPLKLALLNEGVHTSSHTNLFSSSHTKETVENTLVAYENALTSLRKEGLL